jgi:hypothetical protein
MQSDLVVQKDEPMSDAAVTMFERLALDPSVNVEKLERLIEMQQRIMRHTAKAAFDAAFSEMQGEIPVITELGEIKVEGKLRSRYATNEDIQEALKPILQKHGFALRFRNESTDKQLKVIGILSHRGGHSEQDEFVTAPDTSGSKNSIQAIGSSRAYGQRYTTISLLNIATREPGKGADDDGVAAGKKVQPVAPAGYQDWLDDMRGVSSEGAAVLTKAWADSKPEFRQWVNQYDADTYRAIKAAALAVKK